MTESCFLSSSGLRKESSHCSVLLLLFVLDRPVYDVGSFLLPACMHAGAGGGVLFPLALMFNFLNVNHWYTPSVSESRMQVSQEKGNT